MILLCVCFVQAGENPWTLFDTERELLHACAMCTKYVRLKKAGNRSLDVAENSECAQSDTTNRFCRLMRFINESNACASSGPCVPQSIASHQGKFCYSCRFISSFLMLFAPEQRLAKARLFCAGARAFFSDFCVMLDGEGIETYVNALNRYNSPMKYCTRSKMCKKVPEVEDEL